MLYKAKGLRIDAVVVVMRDMGTKKVPRNDTMSLSFFCLPEKLEAFVLVFKSFFWAIAYHQPSFFFFFLHKRLLKAETRIG